MARDTLGPCPSIYLAKYQQTREPWGSVSDRSLFGIDALRNKLEMIQVKIRASKHIFYNYDLPIIEHLFVRLTLSTNHMSNNMLSTNQIGMLKDTLPEIQKEIAEKRLDCMEQLRSLGEDLSTPGARRLKFSNVVNDFCTLVRETTEGKNTEWDAGDAFTLRARLEQYYRDFAVQLKKTRLSGFVGEKGTSVMVTTNGKELPGTIWSVRVTTKGENVFYVKPADIVKAGDMDHFVSNDDSRYTRKSEHDSPGDYRFLEGRVQTEDDSSGGYRPEKEFYRLPKKKFFFVPIAENDVRPDDYDFLRDRIVKQQTRALPIFPSVELFNKLVSDAVSQEWESLSLTLVNDANDLLEKFLKWALEKVRGLSSSAAHV